MARDLDGLHSRPAPIGWLYQPVSNYGPPREGLYINTHGNDHHICYCRNLPLLLCCLSWPSPRHCFGPRIAIRWTFLETPMPATTYQQTIIDSLPPRNRRINRKEE